MNDHEPNGIVNRPSNHSVHQTTSRLQRLLAEKGVKPFALADHSGEADQAGLKMRPTPRRRSAW